MHFINFINDPNDFAMGEGHEGTRRDKRCYIVFKDSKHKIDAPPELKAE